jgi:hypothetical protein
VVAVYDIA